MNISTSLKNSFTKHRRLAHPGFWFCILFIFITVYSSYSQIKTYDISKFKQKLTFPESHQFYKMQSGNVDTLSSIPNAINLMPNEYLFSRRNVLTDTLQPSKSPLILDNLNSFAKATYLPEDYLLQITSNNDLVPARPLLVQENPLIYMEERKTFRGSFYIMLENSEDAVNRDTLTQSLEVLLASEASLDPGQVNLAYTNWPPMTVGIEAKNPVDSVQVRAHTPAHREGLTKWLKVKPALLFETTGRSIQGWGVQSIPVVVTIRGTTIKDSVAVTLSLNQGHAKPAEIFIKPNRTGRFNVRSAGLGSATLTAISPQFENASMKLEYIFPYIFLGFALVGGALGGIIAYFRKRSKGDKTSFWLNLGGGLTWGFVVAIGYFVLGINLLEVDIQVVSYFNEFAVFGISALGGIGWAMKNSDNGN